MNRDIEFRGLTGSVKGDIWVYGTPYKVKSLFSADERYYIRNKHANDHIVDSKTIGQYTGLKDKNGKKIFEGDIVNIKYQQTTIENAIIEYHGTSFYGCTNNDMWELDDYCSVEVIGNIYENKELLEG